MKDAVCSSINAEVKSTAKIIDDREAHRFVEFHNGAFWQVVNGNYTNDHTYGKVTNENIWEYDLPAAALS